MIREEFRLLNSDEIENAPRSCLRFADDDQTHAAHAPRAFTIRTQRRERNERTKICSNLHRFFEGRFLLLLFKPGGRGGVPFVFPIGDELQFVDIARLCSLLVLLFLHLLFVVFVSLSRPRRRRCCHLLIHKTRGIPTQQTSEAFKKASTLSLCFLGIGGLVPKFAKFGLSPNAKSINQKNQCISSKSKKTRKMKTRNFYHFYHFYHHHHHPTFFFNGPRDDKTTLIVVVVVHAIPTQTPFVSLSRVDTTKEKRSWENNNADKSA